MTRLDHKGFLEHLKNKGLITETAQKRAETASTKTGTPVERTLLEFGLVGEDNLFRELAEFLDLRFLPEAEIHPDLVGNLAISTDFLERVGVLPAVEDENVVWVATSNPEVTDTIQSIGFHLQLPVRMAIATPSAIKSALSKGRPGHQTGTDVSESDIERLNALANDGPTIKLVNDIVADAVRAGASDVHIEAGETGCIVRFRVDGTLQTSRHLPEAQRSSVISRLKVMADLNISEKRRPQDGRAQVSVRGKVVDIRMSTLPTQFGESIVLRLLDRSRVSLDWEALGFSPGRVAQIERITNLPNGVFLVAGPTGSGKTTTLYTALSGLNSDMRKIVTVEDPIEYTLAGINQVQVEPAIDMTFARALRAILRQDPDIIMVGEIRDHETAEIAVRAALVGRLVLSTIHTNDSISAVTRLIDLGVPPYLLSATLRGVLSQRLVRTVCNSCGGSGCGACDDTGMRGRTVISELLEVDQAVSAAVSTDAREHSLSEAARSQGFRSMREQATELVAMGRLDVNELKRVLGMDIL